jgi:hypothetical protein
MSNPIPPVGMAEEAMHLEDDLVFDDGPDEVPVLERECRDAITEMLDEVELPAAIDKDPADLVEKFEPTNEYSGKVIFKSTLVSELNGNPFLSKNRLIRIRNSIYFNNAEDYLNAANSSFSCSLGLGSDCGVYFVQKSSLNTTSAVQTVRKGSRNSSSRSGDPTNVSAGIDSRSW